MALAGLVVARLPAQNVGGAARRDLVVATTTSVRDAGLLDFLVPAFERASRLSVRVLAVGSGQAMEIGRRGEADLLIVHDPLREEEFVKAGFGVDRGALMHNEFVILGPAADPAGVRNALTATTALQAVAARKAAFVSRGDRSGTHAREQALWALAGLDPDGKEWYRETGQGMGQTLQIANELQAYTLSDVGTFLAHKSPLDLVILVEGDTLLRNPYHVILASPGRFPWVNADGARRLRDYLLDPQTQRQIGEFGRAEFGRSLFFPAQPIPPAGTASPPPPPGRSHPAAATQPGR